jgi:hypothetical protein
MSKRDWKIYRNETTGMWWTELDGKAIAESSSLEMAADALERRVKPMLPPYWTIQVYEGRVVWLRLAGRHPHDTTAARLPAREGCRSIATLVEDAWTAFEIDYPEAVIDEAAELLPLRTCGYDFFVVEASNREIEDGWLAEWSNEAGDCHHGPVRQYRARAIGDAWKAAREVATAGGVCEKEN